MVQVIQNEAATAAANFTLHDVAPWAGTDFEALNHATHGLDAPFGVIDLRALATNAHAMLQRAGGVPIRVASKSIRVRSVLESVLALPGYAGVLAYTLREAIWLVQHGIDDVVVGYPTVDLEAIGELVADPRLAQQITLMVDSVDHLDAVDAVIRPSKRPAVRVAIDQDMSLRSSILGHIGVRRSPIHDPREAFELAAAIVRRPGFALVGMMGYEAQIAGLGNAPIGKPLMGFILRALQSMSAAELHERRAAAVRAVRSIADLEFVNGGGTGSLESTASDASVTEIAAGSGPFAPTLFDNSAHFRHAPAALVALAVARRPTPEIATIMGGGWIASGPHGADRAPSPVHPAGLKFVPREGAGEVQTPVTGPAARDLAIGDRVWFRHTKAGELSEHLDTFVVVDGARAIGTVPTYRGEGKVFL